MQKEISPAQLAAKWKQQREAMIRAAKEDEEVMPA